MPEGSIEHQEAPKPLVKGQTVYFIEPNNIIGAKSPDFTLEVKKASVTDIEGRQFPILTIWDDATKDPEGIGVSVAKSPKEIFTSDELQELMSKMEEPAEKRIDELIKDPQGNRKLAFALSAIVQERTKNAPNH